MKALLAGLMVVMLASAAAAQQDLTVFDLAGPPIQIDAEGAPKSTATRPRPGLPWYDHVLLGAHTGAQVLDYGTTWANLGPYCHEGNGALGNKPMIAVIGMGMTALAVATHVKSARAGRPLRWWQRLIAVGSTSLHGGFGIHNARLLGVCNGR